MALNATWYSFNVHPQEATVLVKGSTMLWEDWLLQWFHAADNDNGYLFLVTILRSNFGLLPYETSLVDGSVEMRSLQGSLRAFLAGG